MLALGSNLGDRLSLLQGAVDALADTPGCGSSRVSPVYETDPVGGPEQPDYLNAVVVAEGRTRRGPCSSARWPSRTPSAGVAGRAWGPRTLDVDVVAVGDLEVATSRTSCCRTRGPHERAFVLVPWLDVDPAAELPGAGPVAALVERLELDGVRRRDDLDLVVPS